MRVVAVMLTAHIIAVTSEPLRIDLQKRTLDLNALNAQHSLLRQRYLGASLNGGDDIPLLDFMDAQVWPSHNLVTSW